MTSATAIRIEGEVTNDSGLRPVDDRILVLPIEVEQQTDGGVWIPDDAKERQQMAQEQGIVVAKGAMAFAEWHPDDVPEIGDQVTFARYAGKVIKGRDNCEYRILDDEEIYGIVE